MYRLYCRKGAGSMAVEALLAVLGVDHELVSADRDADGKPPAFLAALNPRAEVPTLVLPDDSVMTESAAIMIFLADSYPQAGLAPAIGSPDRPQFLRWMIYMATTLYMSDLRLYYPQRYTARASEAIGIKEKAASAMTEEVAILADALGGRQFLAGARMTAVDIYAAMLLNWMPDMAETFARHPNLAALYARVTGVEAIAAVWRRNEA